jgi:hypothetical protein
LWGSWVHHDEADNLYEVRWADNHSENRIHSYIQEYEKGNIAEEIEIESLNLC